MLWPPPPVERPVAKPAPVPEPVVATKAITTKSSEPGKGAGGAFASLVALALVAGWLGLRYGMAETHIGPDLATFLQHLTVFVLACFVGWQVVWSVTAALHTPLMSVTNAISGIIIVGGILQAMGDTTSAPVLVGAAATLFATINIFGGFFVTKRMLQMFQR